MKISLQQKPGNTTIINGDTYLFFSGYSYLGLGDHPEYLAHLHEGIRTYGMVYPSSRISNTPLDLFEAFENSWALRTQQEDAACFSSGYLASRTAAEILAENEHVYALPHTHPSTAGIYHATFLQDDFSWTDFLKHKRDAGEMRFTLLADSIYPTPGLITSFDFLHDTPADFSIRLLIDDAHGIGWMGNDGAGISNLLQLPPHITPHFVFSLSKSYHMNAGVIAGPNDFMQRVRQHVNFSASTPPSPASIYAWLQSQAIFTAQRNRLNENIAYLRKLTQSFDDIHHHGTPIFTIDRKGIAEYLLANKIIISSFSYPLPGNDPVNRVVVNALHTPSNLEQLANTIAAH